ncbi:MAG: hypothetical protein AAGI91_08145 [Bacteroidota bacterium]
MLLGLLLLAVKSQDRAADIDEVGYKTQELNELQAETVFLGSSRTYRHVDVTRFDSLRGGGNSYNFGMRGGTALEVHYQAERMLELPHVRWLVLELGTVRPLVRLENRDTRRTYYYHDLRRVKLASDVTLAFDMPLMRRLEIIRGRLKVALDHYFLVGQGEALITGRTVEPEPFSRFDRRGFSALDYAENAGRRSEAFRHPKGQEAFRRKLERLRHRDAEPTAADSAMASIWIDLYRRAEAQDVEVYFAEQVGEVGLDGLARVLGDALPPGHLIILNDMERYPGLFDPDLWFDPGHLNERGAEQVTDILAARLPPASS